MYMRKLCLIAETKFCCSCFFNFALGPFSVYVSEKNYLHKWLSEQPIFHDKVYAEQETEKTKNSSSASWLSDQFPLHPLYIP